MTVTPAGYMSAPLASLREMVASTAAFKSWTGAASTAAAESFVHVISTPSNPTLPMALLDFGTWSRKRVAIKNGRQFQTTPGSEMIMYFRDTAGDDEPDAAYEFCNSVGAILADLETIAGVYAQETLAITEVRMVAAPQRIPTDMRPTAGDYYESAFALTYSRQP